MNHKKPVYIVILWAVIILFSIISNELTLGSKTVVYLKTIPVDPRDMFMGDYVTLNYEIAQLSKYQSKKYKLNETIYITLNTDENKTATVKQVLNNMPNKNDIYLKGKVTKCAGSFFFNFSKCAKFGIESYYVKEGEGSKLEKNLRDGAEVEVAISKNGKAKVKGFRKI